MDKRSQEGREEARECISTTAVPVPWQAIYASPIDDLRSTILDLSLYATPCRYRFFDCKAFVEENKVVIYETQDPADVPYTTISYTWRGNDTNLDDPLSPSYWKDVLGTFHVEGGEDGDPISLDVLLHVCTLSLRDASSRFVWFDRLCIIQTSKPDKMWQISRMNGIHKSCEMCCILPGGIRRLVRLEEETSWIHRGWTLQEAIVPKHATVLYAWSHAMDGEVVIGGGFMLTPVISCQSAHTELRVLLQSSLMSSALVYLKIDSVKIPLEFGIFGDTGASAALMGALASDYPNGRYQHIRYQYIWRSALLRTSSRPVDMVFSIMGLFGVSLNPGAFHADDRLGATIALAKEILQKGEEASWIGAAYVLDPCPRFCTFPEFPETSVSGKAYLRTVDGSLKEVAEVMSQRMQLDRYLDECPGGSMDDEGYMIMRARAVRVFQMSLPSSTPPILPKTPDEIELEDQDVVKMEPRLGLEVQDDHVEFEVQDNDGIELEVQDDDDLEEWETECSYEKITLPAKDGSVWKIHDGGTTSPDRITYLVYLGRETQSLSAAFPREIYSEPFKGWILQEHAPNRFHRLTHLNISEEHEEWLYSLPMLELAVGGPESIRLV